MLRLKNPLESIFMGTSVLLIIVLLVEISLVGKSLTYSTRFTPPSTELNLKNATYFTEGQVAILLFSSLLVLLLPMLVYSIFLKTKRFFVPLWAGFMALTALLLLCNTYFLTGSPKYHDYLTQLAKSIDNSPGYCEENLCNRVSCVRISTFEEARKMTIACSVITILAAIYIVVAGFLINRRRRKTNEIELIM